MDHESKETFTRETKWDGTFEKRLKQPEKIITISNGQLILEKENLKKIMHDYIKDDPAVAFVSVIGPPQSGKSFMTNLIIHLGANSREGGWLERLVKDGQFKEGFQFGCVTSSDKLFTSTVSNGVYVWPTPFPMTKANGDKVYIWVMHYQILDVASASTVVDVNSIENVLGLMCSRILEILTENDELRIAKTRRHFSFPQNVCDSVVVVYCSESTINSFKVLTEESAKKWILNLEADRETNAETYESILNEFNHLNLFRIKRISAPLHDKDGRLNHEAIKSLIIPLKSTVNYFLLEENEIVPKKISEGKWLTASKVEMFLNSCVDCANDFSSKSYRTPMNVPTNEQIVIKEQKQANEDQYPILEKANEYDGARNFDECSLEISSTPIASTNIYQGTVRDRENDKVVSAAVFISSTEVPGTIVKDEGANIGCPEDSISSNSWRHCLRGDNELRAKTLANLKEVALKKGKLTPEQLQADLIGFVNLSKESRQDGAHVGKVLMETSIGITEDVNQIPIRNLTTSCILEKESENRKPMQTFKHMSEKNEDSESSANAQVYLKSSLSTASHQTYSGQRAEVLYPSVSASESFLTPQGISDMKEEQMEVYLTEPKMPAHEVTDAMSWTEIDETEAKTLEDIRRLELENKQQEAHSKVVNEAVAHVKKVVCTRAYSWVNKNANNPEKIQDFFVIFEECFNHVLMCNYEHAISPYFWEDFCKSVHFNCFNDCTTFLKTSFDPVCEFNKELERQFQLYGYFQAKSFENMKAQMEAKLIALRFQMDANSYALMTSAISDLLNIYKSMNSTIMESERGIQEDMGQQVKCLYSQEMKRYLAENGPYTSNDLYHVHSELKRRLLELSRNIATPTLSFVLPDDAENWISNLELELSNAFTEHKESNTFRLVSLRKQIDKILSERYNAYVTKMEDILRKYPGGYDPEKLESYHNTFSNEQRKLLCVDLVRKIRETEPAELYCDSLMYQINKYWPKIVKANQENLEKTKSPEAQRSKQTESSRQLEPTTVTSDSIAKSRESKTNLVPLIFRLSYSHVAMGAVVNGKIQVLSNARGETSTPVAVALNKNAELVHGTEAMKQQHYWWITNYLGRCSQSIQENVHIKQGENRFVVEINVEFLLGYLMQSLKNHVEHQLRQNFAAAIVTIPHWFCSTHRLQVKDAAKSAGFDEVHLVNEESAAAYAFFDQNSSRGSLLVLSENFGIVSVILYSKSESTLGSIAMISHKFAYSQVEKKKGFEQWLMHPMKSIKDAVSSHAPKPPKLSKESKIATASEICDQVFKRQRIYKGHELWPKHVMFLVDSENVDNGNSDWLQAFEVVVNDSDYGGIADIGKGVNGSGLAVLLGVSALCHMPLEKVGEFIRDAFVHSVIMFTSSLQRNEYAIRVDDIRFLPEKLKVFEQQLPGNARNVQYFQQSPFDDTTKVLVGILVLGPGIPDSFPVYPTFEINSEGIVTLKEVRCDTFQSQKELTNDYYWTTPNLFNYQRDDIKDVIKSCTEQPMDFAGVALHETSSVVTMEAKTESQELREAKVKLLQAINDIEQGFQNDGYNFRSKIHAQQLQTKFKIAKCILAKTDPEVGLDEIQKATFELLEKHNQFKKL